MSPLKYNDESSDLTVNLMLTLYKCSFLIGQLKFEVSLKYMVFAH